MPAAALPDNVLRARYEALGKLEEWPGERTFISRCRTFNDLIENGARVADDIARAARSSDPEEVVDLRNAHPGLFDLIREAWPTT